MDEKSRKKLESKAFGVAISHLDENDIEKLIEIYQNDSSETLLKELIENKIQKIVSKLDYYSLLDHKFKISIEHEKLFGIVEERKVFLINNVLNRINDPLKCLELIRKEQLGSKTMSLIREKLNQLIETKINIINDLDDLVSCLILSNNESEVQTKLIEKVKNCLSKLSYKQLLNKQKNILYSNSLVNDLVENEKINKLSKILNNIDDLDKVCSFLFQENLFSKSSELIKDYLAVLVLKKINQINDINSIISYYLWLKVDSKAKELLHIKFSQLLANYSYQELIKLGKRTTLPNQLKKSIESRKAEILPDILEKINDPSQVLDLIYNEGLSSSVLPLLNEKLSKLISPLIEKLDDLDEIVSYFNFVSAESNVKLLLRKKLIEKIDYICDFEDLFRLYLNFFFTSDIKNLLKKRIFYLLKKTKDSVFLTNKFLDAIYHEEKIPQDLREEINSYLQKTLL